MNPPTNLDRTRRASNLDRWTKDTQAKFNEPHRFPGIEFDADSWPLKSKYQTKTADINFALTIRAFSHLDATYIKALRCIAAEVAIEDDKKECKRMFSLWRSFAAYAPNSLLDMRREHLRTFEAVVLQECIEGASASDGQWKLGQLLSNVTQLARLGVIEPVGWQVSHECRRRLRALDLERRIKFREEKNSILDRQIEALSDAMRAMLVGDPRLSSYDRSVLALMGIVMCAPCRINEPLCMALDDVITLEDYAIRPEDKEAFTELGRTHMLLLQKGSKGADWGAKPALNFMLGLLSQCIAILKEGGKRSRALVEWYEKNPTKLYLPQELEHLRGNSVSRFEVWQIINLSDKAPTSAERSGISSIFRHLKTAGKITVERNPRPTHSGHNSTRPTIEIVAWPSIEEELLRRVHDAMNRCRRVSTNNSYQGRLSNMLMLNDAAVTPYLPGSIKYQTFTKRLKMTSDRLAYSKTVSSGNPPEPTIFQKLDLTMVVNGKIEHAWIETHDPRRWLTTKAMQAKERLSDVLINKWANRVSIEQLEHYDLRSDSQRANQAAIPIPQELTDVSVALQSIQGLEAEYGLRTDIVTVHETAISMTSMEAIGAATADRPVARTANQIIILYPTRFGACTHQHHETPCRSYTCLPCGEGLALKGHLPTNAEIRLRDQLMFKSIVNQLDRLATSYNRDIADLPEQVEEHMLALVQMGLTTEQVADTLIDQFNEIKDRIKSPTLRNRLEEAFVARGIVRRLDAPDIPSGALIRYHNPGRHASPGHERALDAYGGRTQVDAEISEFHRQHPQFAPTKLGLRDERDLLEQDDDDD